MNIRILADTPPSDWQKSAADLLKDTLRHREAADRDIAVILSGEIVVMADEMAELLLGIANDSSESDEMRRAPQSP